MSQLKFDKPLQISLKRSFYYRLYVHMLYGIALLVLLLPYDVSLWLRAILFLFIVFSYFSTNRSSRQLYTGQLRLMNDQHWLWLHNDNEQPLVFDSGTIILSRMMVFNFISANGKKISWCFFPDHAEDELFRRLRIYLRYSTAEKSSDMV